MTIGVSPWPTVPACASVVPLLEFQPTAGRRPSPGRSDRSRDASRLVNDSENLVPDSNLRSRAEGMEPVIDPLAVDDRARLRL